MNTTLFLQLSLLSAIFSLFIASHATLAAADENAAISEPVTALHNTLLDNMKHGDSSNFNQRYAKLEPVITAKFDTPLISKVILGRYWKTLDEQGQNEFIDLFNQLTIATYANRFDSYSNQRFEQIDIESMKRGRQLVKTELRAPGEEPVVLNYIVQNDQGTWKIISVIANGVNDLSLKRAEYSAVIKDSGYDVLVADIRKKIAQQKE